MVTDLKQLVNFYGSLNDIVADPNTPVGDRRLTTVKSALQATLASYYTTNALAGRDTYRGILLAALPTPSPPKTSKGPQFDVQRYQISDPSYIDPQLLWYTYKVYIPEIDPRYIRFHKPKKLLADIMSMADIGMSSKLIYQGMNKKIAAGTLVTVRLENPKKASSAEIIEIGPLLFTYDITGVQEPSKFPGTRRPMLYGSAASPRAGDHAYPGDPTTGAFLAPQITTGAPQTVPSDVLACANQYDNEGAIPYKSYNASRIDTLHTEFKPYCKCFILRCWQRGVEIKLASTARTNDWQIQHRRWWLMGDSRQPIIAGPGWSSETVRLDGPVAPGRGSSNIVSGPNKGGSHNIGFAFDYNAIINGQVLGAHDHRDLWVNGGIQRVASDLGLRWGGDWNAPNYDPIHCDGNDILRSLGVSHPRDILMLAKEKRMAPNAVPADQWATA